MPRSLDFFSRGRKNRSGQGQRRWGQMKSRLRTQAENTLGIIMTDQMGTYKKVRKDDLDLYDQYYEGCQYKSLVPWDQAVDSAGEYIPVRKREPRIKYNLAKVLTDKVAAKLIGTAVFPKFVIEGDPDDTAFFSIVQKAASYRANLLEPIRHALLSGSSFVRFYLVDGVIEMEWTNSKYCYPVFDAKGELEQIEVKYVYEDPYDKDGKGAYKKKWYRMILSTMVDVMYDNPEYREGSEPTFQEVQRMEHGLGWVQGEWFRTGKDKFSPDGPSLIGEILDFIDEFNYSLSQTSQAVAYNQDPQLVLNNMDEDEIDKMIRSSQKGWNLGREGEAQFVESSMKGVEVAETQRDHFRNRMLEVVRVVLHDPETIVGQASSGKALEIMHAPLLELIDELRTVFEPSLKNLLIKLGMTIIAFESEGLDTMIEMPQGYQPSSLDLVVRWPAIFPLTLEDIQKKVTAAAAAAGASILSRESALRWLAPEFGIEDIDEELAKLAAQPVINPFGTF